RIPDSSSGLSERCGTALPRNAIPELWQKADERLTRTYRMCGRLLRLRSNSITYAQRFERAFFRLKYDGLPVDATATELTFLTADAGPEGRPALIDRQRGRVRVFERREIEPTQLFYCLAFVERQMFTLEAHVIVHGSV